MIISSEKAGTSLSREHPHQCIYYDVQLLAGPRWPLVSLYIYFTIYGVENHSKITLVYSKRNESISVLSLYVVLGMVTLIMCFFIAM